MRLLLVDDDSDTRELLSLYFERQGVEVDAVGSFQAAEQALNSQQYGALLTDLRLPDGNGRELLRGGRPAHLTLAVVVSGDASDEDRRRSLAAGFDSHLLKPLDRETLATLVATADRR
jgi:DNA-binding response OmpR family regulator